MRVVVMVIAVDRPSGSACRDVASATRPPTPASLVLPPPTALDIDDALTVLMKLSAAINEAQTQCGAASAHDAGARRDAATARRKELLEKAIEAARKAAEAREEGGLLDA